MMNPNNRIEKRNNCFVPVDGKSGSSFADMRTVDFSSHGIGFISSHLHHIDEKIAIELQMKPNTDAVMVMGIVKWVSQIPDSKQYRIGLRYDEIL